ncbi:MAG TPA: alpha/beta fold hydrolase [Longimicrobiales bacterium]|nr:alpha/beta fold hydrolase [Longimicrobiales bacterium]
MRIAIGMCVALCLSAGCSQAVREAAEAEYESRFVDAAGVRLHYLDFGGDGLPVVFVHSEGWDATTYAEFAPRLTAGNRVLAVTRPGYGESEPHPDGFGIETQARSLIDFLDALGIERAVFAGNSSPIVYLTYLAEHHPDRVAGVIYLAGLMPMWLDHVVESDPAGAGAMASRAMTSDPVARERSRILSAYRPHFLGVDSPTIHVPALAFAGRSGLIGYESFSWPLALTGSALMSDFHAELPPSPISDHLRRLIDDPAYRDESIAAIDDTAARAFLARLVDDPDLQAEVWRYQQETVRPALIADQERFRRAFDRLRLVRLDVSTIYGYEYRDAPDLIAPHIRRFLDDLDADLYVPEIADS